MKTSFFVVCFMAVLVKTNADWQGDKFMDCCQAANIECASDACKYPPPALAGIDTELCEGNHINEFVKCYTGGQDNTQCCHDAGVSGFYGMCQDFCNGTNPQLWANPAYTICKFKVDDISKCNHDGVRKTDDECYEEVPVAAKDENIAIHGFIDPKTPVPQLEATQVNCHTH
uniref:Domain of unknown function DB domain-containing protein n=1 Tax=Ditylenchus dipsaci TaxID=166011 RepID=A0A915CQ88_9BILA